MSLSYSRLVKKLPTVRDWLSAAGAEVLDTTNEYEVLRFRSNGQTSIIYRNAANRLTFTGEAQLALQAWLDARSWRANARTPRIKVSPEIKTLRARDGDLCFACWFRVSETEASVDHLVAATHGGPNHISNYVLMHQACNAACHHMSAAEKIRMHVEARLAATR
jgi:hypothetical protein